MEHVTFEYIVNNITDSNAAKALRFAVNRSKKKRFRNFDEALRIVGNTPKTVQDIAGMFDRYMATPCSTGMPEVWDWYFIAISFLKTP